MTVAESVRPNQSYKRHQFKTQFAHFLFWDWSVFFRRFPPCNTDIPSKVKGCACICIHDMHNTYHWSWESENNIANVKYHQMSPARSSSFPRQNTKIQLLRAENSHGFVASLDFYHEMSSESPFFKWNLFIMLFYWLEVYIYIFNHIPSESYTVHHKLQNVFFRLASPARDSHG